MGYEEQYGTEAEEGAGDAIGTGGEESFPSDYPADGLDEEADYTE